MTTAAIRRKDYRHFPAFYQELVERYERDGVQRVGPMTVKDARSSARDFNRYKMFLIKAVDEQNDAFAKELLDIFNRFQVRIDIAAEDEAFIELKPHPLAAAMERLAAGED